jgi:mRNA interferase YafQ
MRTIRPTTRFRRDFKSEKKGPHSNRLDAMLAEVTDMLAADALLPPPLPRSSAQRRVE